MDHSKLLKVKSMYNLSTLKPVVFTVRIQTASTFCKGKVKFSHTRYRALGPELIPVYRQSARR